MVDPRFTQLLDNAREGDENAISDLWNEFEFEFHSEVAPDNGRPVGGAQC